MSSFQSLILQLQSFWASRGCLITQPYYTQVGAGTMNPATFLRVLGPEPWNVAYVEPSVRPDDGRYGENPNRFQLHYQYQVILKPDPGNPQELYLNSLKAIGIDPRQHDIRFVEDNWAQPAISAWGLGWEIWLDGQEITQFTYFQQVGGVTLDPVSVELTYGLERILIALNNAPAIWDEIWGSAVTYGEVRRQEEFEHSKYYFEIADVARVRQMYDLYKAEAEACLANGLILPAHDYVLKCSHVFNTLDTRGAIGVTERQAFFGQMREMARRVALAYLEQRKELEYPLLREPGSKGAGEQGSRGARSVAAPLHLCTPAPFLLEIGVEEMPASDLNSALEQLKLFFEQNILKTYYLKYKSVKIFGTPRRLVVYVDGLEPQGETTFTEVKGPPESACFDKDGKPTKALLGWIKKNELVVPDEFMTREYLIQPRDGGRYAVRQKETEGSTVTILFPRVLPVFIRDIKFEKTMRWNSSNVAFSRPIRWLVALLGETVIPFEYAGVVSGRITRGLRPYDSPEIEIKSADKYFDVIKNAGIVLDTDERKASIVEQVRQAAALVGGEAIIEEGLLAEVTNLVEMPTVFMGGFDPQFLQLPRDVLISVMKKHQRYFPVENKSKVEKPALSLSKGQKSGDGATFELRPSTLLPYFIAIRNGDDLHLDTVREGNEHVLGARFSDADFFVREDLKHKLEDFRPRLGTLIFQKKLGSMLDKSGRIEKLVNSLVPMLGLDADEAAFARRAAHLAKADLVTKMVIEMTSLQGVIGREYALRSGESQAVAEAIGEQYQPVPKTKAGLAVALADRLDSLVGLFAAGLAPTGTKDPFGLRRAAIGVVQPLIEQDISFDLRAAVEKAASLQPIEVSAEVQGQVLEFLTGRLSVLLKDAGHKYDVVDAVLAAQAADPASARRAVAQLQAWTERQDWHEILPAYARCVRILRSSESGVESRQPVVNPKVFVEEAEKELYAALQEAQSAIVHQPSAVSVDDFLNAFLPMIPAINAFFDKVLVMAEDEKLKQNRLALVGQIANLSYGIADMSKLEGF